MSETLIQTKHQFSFDDKFFHAISWRKSNDTKKWTIALHGFGRSPLDFLTFAEKLQTHEGIIAISLFAHNESSYFNSDETLHGWDPKKWESLLDFLIEEFSINNCHLLCYSLGGRLGLKWIELCPHKIQSATFYAPDGLVRNKLYRFTVGTTIGHWFSRRIVKNPTPVILIAKALNKIGILPTKLFNFVLYHLNNAEIRSQVFNVWMGYRKLYPNLKLVAFNLSNYKIQTEFIFGNYDAIIPWKHGKKLRKYTSNNSLVTWTKLQKGHQLF
jgi:pimeloyl-ACP methyl ester carboxylesterase